jgi:hypothetical protein
MKKTLLLIGAFVFSITTNAQTLDSENFNTLSLGNTHTVSDLTFAGGSGIGSYFRSVSNGDATAAPPQTTNNASNSNVQIVANGLNGTRGMQITNPNGSGGFRQILKNGYQTSTWATRTTGNDVLDVSVSFFTGAATTSITTNRFVVTGDDATAPAAVSILGMDYDFDTREITGLGRLNNGGTRGFFFFRLGPDDTMGDATPLIAPANTWVTLTMSYNSATGEFLWATDLNGGTLTGFNAAALMIPGLAPTTNQIYGFSDDANTTVSSVIIDNYTVTAVSMSTLSTQEIVIAENEIKLFPNPAKGVLHISSSLDQMSSVSIVDLNGRLVKSLEVNANNVTADIQDLKPGLYILNISNSGGTVSRKFIKE